MKMQKTQFRRMGLGLTIAAVIAATWGCNGEGAPSAPSATALAPSLHVPSEMQSGCRYAISYALKNDTDERWEPGILKVGVRWFSAETNKVVSSDRRQLSRPVAPGESLEIDDAIAAPDAPGSYRLVIGLVEEGVRWVPTDPKHDRADVTVVAAPAYVGPGKPAGKIRLIGLDGATWDVLLPWIEAGKLPNFARVLREGSWGPLRTLPGSLSPVMWTSIATGYERDKHGIEGFQVRDGYGMRLVRSSDRKVPAIWNLASQYDLETYIVNWQVTDPAEAINGVMVSRLRELGETAVYPPGLTEELATVTDAVKLPPAVPEDSVQGWRRVLREDLEKLIAVERFLSSRGRLDLAAYYTHSTDEAQHRFWKYMEPDAFTDPLLRPSPDDVKEHGNAIFEVYERIDDWIGESWSPEEEILVLVSDHGAQADPQPRVYLSLNPLLAALGFAELTESGEVITKASQAFNCTENPWSFHLTICLNLVGPEPNGIVPPEKAVTLSRDIAQRLTSLRLTDDTALIKSVKPSVDGTSVEVEAIRPSGSQIEEELEIQGRRARLRDYLTIHDDISGQHSSFGILAIAGGPVLVGRIHNADLLDVAPTILYLLGLPVADDMEGSPLTEIVEPRYLEEHPVYRTASFDPLAVQDEASPVSGQEEDEAQKELKERLRSLGYIQ